MKGNYMTLWSKSNNISKTAGEFFILWIFCPLTNLIDTIVPLLTLGIFWTSFGLWGATKLARYRQRRTQ